MGVWRSKGNHLQLNVSKIKGLVVDFRQSEKLLTPVIILGEEVETVRTYTYLCVCINKTWPIWQKRDTVRERAAQPMQQTLSSCSNPAAEPRAFWIVSINLGVWVKGLNTSCIKPLVKKIFHLRQHLPTSICSGATIAAVLLLLLYYIGYISWKRYTTTWVGTEEQARNEAGQNNFIGNEVLMSKSWITAKTI